MAREMKVYDTPRRGVSYTLDNPPPFGRQKPLKTLLTKLSGLGESEERVFTQPQPL